MPSSNDTLSRRIDEFFGEIGEGMAYLTKKTDGIDGIGDGEGWHRFIKYEKQINEDDKLNVIIELVIRDNIPVIVVSEIARTVVKTYFHLDTKPTLIAGFMYSRFFAPSAA